MQGDALQLHSRTLGDPAALAETAEKLAVAMKAVQ
jgi:hypothetical protein